MIHEHEWELSTNETCPKCEGEVQMCMNGGCRRYKCEKHGTYDLTHKTNESYPEIQWIQQKIS